MLKVLLIFGTRPEAIKLAPVIKEFSKYPDKVICKVCVTAQHRQMLDWVVNLFVIKLDYELGIKEEKKFPIQVASVILTQLKPIFPKEEPEWVLVRGSLPRWPQWTWLAEATQRKRALPFTQSIICPNQRNRRDQPDQRNQPDKPDRREKVIQHSQQRPLRLNIFVFKFLRFL
jgi:hypothetical protein